MSAERMAEIAERVADAKESYLYRTPPQWLADLRWLLDRVRELEGDTARLDEVERRSAHISVFDPDSGDGWAWEVELSEPVAFGNGPTLRAAIDAARSPSGEGQR